MSKRKKTESGVYVITNRVTGMEYVGSTNDLYRRKIEHLSDMRLGKHPNRKLRNSVKKHGFENFEFKIIILTDEDSAHIYEQSYIDKFQPYYNLSSEVGKPKSKTTKVLQYGLDGVYIATYDSMKEAGDKYDISPKAISMVCRGKAFTACRYVWRYYKDDFPLKIEAVPDNVIKNGNEEGRRWNSFWKGSYLINKWSMSGQKVATFTSLKDASADADCEEKTVSAHIRKHPSFPKTLNGYVYRLDGEIVDPSLFTRNKPVLKISKDGEVVSVFKNAKIAASDCALDPRYIYKACNLTNGTNFYKGFYWKFDDGTELNMIRKHGNK